MVVLDLKLAYLKRSKMATTMKTLPDSELTRLKRIFNAKYSTLNAQGALEMCKVWFRAHKYSSINFYSDVLGRSVFVLVHVVSFFLSTGQIPERIGRVKFEISHLCHMSGCCNASHLCREPKSINERRKKCKRQGFCSEDHMPLCLFS